jgi:hypothetical protein
MTRGWIPVTPVHHGVLLEVSMFSPSLKAVVPSIRTDVFIPIALALALVTMSPNRAACSTITWEYDLLVHGTAITYPSLQQLSVPIGTPMVIDVSFDTSTPNDCGLNPTSALYPIGFNATNSATVSFLGYDYSAFGGLEINTILSTCLTGVTDFQFGGLRLFVDGLSGVQVAPNATQIEWFGQFGNLFLELPPSAWLGSAYPSGLPPEPFPFGGHNFLPGTPTLFIDSTELHAVPEPGTAVLIGVGALATAIRRKRG